MNNYEYIIASLPVTEPDFCKAPDSHPGGDSSLKASGIASGSPAGRNVRSESQSFSGKVLSESPSDSERTTPRSVFDTCIEEIRTQLGGKDRETLDFLLSSYDPESLNQEFYDKALRSRVRFIRVFFLYDLTMRNAKTSYLNRRLGRNPEDDLLLSPDPDPQDLKDIDNVLCLEDLLDRERGLDLLLWNKAEETVSLDIFDIDIILSAVVRLKLMDRWLGLDPSTGREMFRKMVVSLKKVNTMKI